MASMPNCEDIANRLATKLNTSIKTKSSGTDKGIAWCNGTLTNNITYQVMDIDRKTENGQTIPDNYDITVSNQNYRAQVNMPRSGNTTTQAANRAGNTWNGSQSNS